MKGLKKTILSSKYKKFFCICIIPNPKTSDSLFKGFSLASLEFNFINSELK